MQENSGKLKDGENEDPENDVEADTDTNDEDQNDARVIKKERNDSHDHRDSSALIPRQSSGTQIHSHEGRKESVSFQCHWPSQPIFRAPSPKPASPPSPPFAGRLTRDLEDPHPKDNTLSSTLYKRPPKLRVHTSSHTSAPTKSPYFTRAKKQRILELPRHSPQSYEEFTIRIPIDEPRWSNMNFQFAAVQSIDMVPEAPVTDLGGGGAKGS
jgi:hypothetical protein